MGRVAVAEAACPVQDEILKLGAATGDGNSQFHEQRRRRFIL